MSANELKIHQRRFNTLKRQYTRGYSMLEGLEEFRARRKAALAGMDILLQDIAAMGDIGHSLQKEIRQFLSKHRKQASIDWDAEIAFQQAAMGGGTKQSNKQPDSRPSFIDWINAREHETHFNPIAGDDYGPAKHRPVSVKLSKVAGPKP